MPKKKGNGEGNIYQMKNGLWCGRLTIGKDENGKQKRKAYYGKTYKEVKQKTDAAKVELNQGTYTEPSKMTVAEWMNIWLRDYNKTAVKAGTFYRTFRTTQKHIIPKLGNYKLKELRKDTIQKFVNDLVAMEYRPSTIDQIYGKLHCALQQAYHDELIPKNPATNMKLPAIEKTEKNVFTPEQQRNFINKAKERKDAYGDIFILLLATGLRISEAIALTWEDVDFEKQQLRINKTRAVVKDVYNSNSVMFGITSPKTRTSNRVIPLLPSILVFLKEIQEKQSRDKLKLNGKYKNVYEKNNLIFCTYKGTHLNTTGAGKNLKRILEEIGATKDAKVTVHSLRHTFATRGLEQGIELKVMQEFLGHAKITMTADLYTHVLPDKKMNSIMKLQDTINL